MCTEGEQKPSWRLFAHFWSPEPGSSLRGIWANCYRISYCVNGRFGQVWLNGLAFYKNKSPFFFLKWKKFNLFLNPALLTSMSSGSSNSTWEQFGRSEAGPVTLEVHQCTIKGPQISHQSASPRGRGAEWHSAVLGHCPPLYIILKTAQHLKLYWKNTGLGIEYLCFPSFHSVKRNLGKSLFLAFKNRGGKDHFSPFEIGKATSYSETWEYKRYLSSL